ncbi:MAG: hypothetical protein DPW16_03575 [Chloroflexi bacterium]|nr:hypothetical protein [Chloroflexota bacterium]
MNPFLYPHMQFFNKLSSLPDKLLPHTDFTVPLPLEACRERLENHLDFGVNRPYKTHEIFFEPIDSENYSFSIEMGDLRIVGDLQSRSETSTNIKVQVKISRQARKLRLITLLGGLSILFLFIGVETGFSGPIFSSDGLLFTACCFVYTILFALPITVFIWDPLGERKIAHRHLKAIVKSLNWPSDKN